MSATPEPEPNAYPAPLPSGTVTFAFTDIEGSTVRWERDPAAMEQAVRRHDALVRAEIVRHGGHVFKTIGDAFCASFSRPQDAVAALLAAQRALASDDFGAVDGIRVRAAIHTGTADERDGDYFGPTVNRVARLLSIGHGGQTLLSGATMALLPGAFAPNVSLRDLGEHRLKDLARPERVYQLVAPDLHAEYPPLRSLDALPNNLPTALTSFVGRETEIAEIAASLAAHRLVTLTGSGGIGKTRTSLQVAANVLDAFRDGVWLIELAPLADGALVPSTIASALGIALPASGDAIENLVRALESKNVLLVFDNCEHLIEPSARIVAALLRGCPQLKVLASSRQGLGIAGEASYRMPSLGVPDAVLTDTFAASDASRYAAIDLFVDRARAIDRSFRLADDNAYAVADICRRLDGIPLAIELAAARVKILSPRQMRDRLHERFRMLTGGKRDVLPRQQTLRALIDWSHDLLDDRERKLFRRLAIFVDGFELEAAVIAGDDDWDDLDVFDVLSSLVDKSLVLAEPAGDAFRYRLLESTNAYGREKLAEAAEREWMDARHLRYVRDRFTEAGRLYDETGRSSDLSAVLVTELGNVRTALDVGLAGIDLAFGGEILVAIDHAWNDLGLEREGRARIEAYLVTLGNGDTLLAARLSIVHARIASTFGQGSLAMESSTLALTRARKAGDAPTIVDALVIFAWNVAAARRFDDADAALAEAERTPFASLRLGLALLNTRAVVSYHRGDLATAARLFEQLRGEHRALGNPSRERMAMLALAEVEYGRGNIHRAIEIVREVLCGVEKNRLRVFRTSLLSNLAGYLMAVDDRAGAREAACEAIEELGATEPGAALVINAMLHLSLAFALDGDSSRAARLAGYIDAVNERFGYRHERTEAGSHDRLIATLREELGPAELQRLLAEGGTLSPEMAIGLALQRSFASP